MWNKHIQEYSNKNGKDPDRVQGILVRGGWDPANYDVSMKSKLFKYLDDWYTLSIKKLPAPATKRRNPGRTPCRHSSTHVLRVESSNNIQVSEICNLCGLVIDSEYIPYYDY